MPGEAFERFCRALPELLELGTVPKFAMLAHLVVVLANFATCLLVTPFVRR